MLITKLITFSKFNSYTYIKILRKQFLLFQKRSENEGLPLKELPACIHYKIAIMCNVHIIYSSFE